jgi:hypothetical protein
MDSTSVAAAACATLGREAAAERLVALTVAHLGLANEGEGAFAELVGQKLGMRFVSWSRGFSALGPGAT